MWQHCGIIYKPLEVILLQCDGEQEQEEKQYGMLNT